MSETFCTVCRHPAARHVDAAMGDAVSLTGLDTRCRVPACSCHRFTLELERRCNCGGELAGSVNHREGLCDRCLLQRRPVPDVDADASRVHLRAWLQARGCVCNGATLDPSCPVHFP